MFVSIIITVSVFRFTSVMQKQGPLFGTEIWTDVRLTYYTSFIWDVLRHVTQFDESQARVRRAGEYLKRTIKKWLSLTIISTAAYTHFSVLLAMVILQTSSKHWETVLSVALFKIFKYVTVIFL